MYISCHLEHQNEEFSVVFLNSSIDVFNISLRITQKYRFQSSTFKQSNYTDLKKEFGKLPFKTNIPDNSHLSGQHHHFERYFLGFNLAKKTTISLMITLTYICECGLPV